MTVPAAVGAMTAKRTCGLTPLDMLSASGHSVRAVTAATKLRGLGSDEEGLAG